MTHGGVRRENLDPLVGTGGILRPMSSGGRLSGVVVLLALMGAGCASGAATTKDPVPPASVAVSASSASAPGGGLDRGLDGSVPSGTKVPIESQVGAGYLADFVVVIGVGNAPSPSSNQSPKVGEYEVAHVSITVLDGSFSYSNAQFTFVDAGGHRFAAVADDAFPPNLGAGTAGIGQTIAGNVVFNVPRGGGTVELRDANGPRLSGWTTTH
jgi:hypothetical protein